MDDPNTVPPVTPDPNTQPGGQSYENIVSLQNTTANNLNTVRAELDAANAKITSLSTPPAVPPATPAPPTTNGADTGGGSLFDFADGLMRMEDGKINPLLVSTFDKIKVPPEMVANFVGHMENSVAYNTHLNNTLITDTVGSQENFNAVAEWGKANLAPDVYTQITQGLQQRTTMKYAMQDLMSQAEAGGFTPPSAVGREPSKEPTPLPPSTGGASPTTPLMPNTPESRAAVTDPRMQTDQAYRQQVQTRLAAGLKSQ